jgi:uncharacterized membrane protein YozB (DUF420 family)
MFIDSRPLTLSDLSLLMQSLIFILLLYSIYRKKGSVAKHGKIAGVAFYLALPSILYMMYSRSKGFTLLYYDSLLSLHMLLGTLAIIIGILFVTNQWKWKGKKYMDLGIILWAGTFLLGFTVYLLLFGLIFP